MVPLTIQESISYGKQNICYISEREFSTNDNQRASERIYRKTYTDKTITFLVPIKKELDNAKRST